MLACEIIYKYKGEMNNAILTNIIAAMEKKMKEKGEKIALIKKINNLLIECCQNVFHHSLKNQNDSTPSCLIVTASGEDYYITIRNLVKAEEVPKLKSYIDKVNGMDREELRQFYKGVLTNGLISEKGGGGLGILNIAKKAKNNKILYNFEPKSEQEYYFNMSIAV
ncbi:MAG: SiaB family protein kinase [Bacteroidia bacterium]|nr:SiaB family protein kinase [Bacteroidia bacterium]MDW8157643.1 SiaB family protein kinase [Bacteroidia bacterium]